MKNRRFTTSRSEMRIIMGKYHFIIIGAGWRALYYVRIAKAMPDIFCLDAVYCRTQEKADKIAKAMPDIFCLDAVYCR
ncbi:MAG: hypothetical protein E7E18_07680, partial [Eubacterium sp.]|nr:hypothetical protein [Eubacterium sp.]